ncbi:protein TANC1 isoform X1 [Lates japonicus]|uniref:Protein TANC1 isoform X1 n=1 Tax=Lates japonicus TaxID=270547 RepID=A0AAD3R116_LATJO|nr:protein TANC1 isoform X1 [Lates japonicus]
MGHQESESDPSSPQAPGRPLTAPREHRGTAQQGLGSAAHQAGSEVSQDQPAYEPMVLGEGPRGAQGPNLSMPSSPLHTHVWLLYKSCSSSKGAGQSRLSAHSASPSGWLSLPVVPTPGNHIDTGKKGCGE